MPAPRGSYRFGTDPIHPAHRWLPNPNFDVRCIGDDASSLTHNRTAPSGGSDFALGELLMTASVPGTHRFLFTVVQSRGAVATGIRVGVSSEDGRRVCAIRVYDGQLYPAAPEGGSPRYSFLAPRGTGREIEVVVDYVKRRLTFIIEGEGAVDSRVTPDALPDAVRPWVQSVYPGDAIVLSSYSFKKPSTRRRPGGDRIAEGLEKSAVRYNVPPPPRAEYYDGAQQAYYDGDLNKITRDGVTVGAVSPGGTSRVTFEPGTTNDQVAQGRSHEQPAQQPEARPHEEVRHESDLPPPPSSPPPPPPQLSGQGPTLMGALHPADAEARLRTSRRPDDPGVHGHGVDEMYDPSERSHEMYDPLGRSSGRSTSPTPRTSPTARPCRNAAAAVAGAAHYNSVRGTRSVPRSKDFRQLYSPPRPLRNGDFDGNRYEELAKPHQRYSPDGYRPRVWHTLHDPDTERLRCESAADDVLWTADGASPGRKVVAAVDDDAQPDYRVPLDYYVSGEAADKEGANRAELEVVEAAEAAGAKAEVAAVVHEAASPPPASPSGSPDGLYPYGAAALPSRIRAVPMSRSEQAIASVAAIKAALKSARVEAVRVEEVARKATSPTAGGVDGDGGAMGVGTAGGGALDSGGDEAAAWVARWLRDELPSSAASAKPVGAGGRDMGGAKGIEPVSRTMGDLAAAALVEPLRGIRPSGGPLARSFVRALAEQPMRQLAVERLLREGGFMEEVAAQICAAAEALRDDDHAHAMRERVRRIDQGA